MAGILVMPIATDKVAMVGKQAVDCIIVMNLLVVGRVAIGIVVVEDILEAVVDIAMLAMAVEDDERAVDIISLDTFVAITSPPAVAPFDFDSARI